MRGKTSVIEMLLQYKMNFLTDASFDVLLIAPGAVAAAVNRRLVVAVAGVAPPRTLQKVTKHN